MDQDAYVPPDAGWALLSVALGAASLKIHAPATVAAVACTVALLHAPSAGGAPVPSADAASARVAAQATPQRGDVAENVHYRAAAAPAPSADNAAAEAPGEDASSAAKYCNCAHTTQLRRSAESRARLLKALNADFGL